MTTAPATRGSQAKRQAEQMRILRQHLNACQTNLQRAQNKIEDLQNQLAAAMRECESQKLTQMSCERVYHDIIKNHGRNLHTRRYCVES